MTTMAINTKMTVSELRWNLKQQLNRFSLNFRAKAVYRYLADKVTIDGVCWPSIATITDDCSLSRRTVIRATRDLEDAGLLKKEPAYRLNGGQTSNRYHLSLIREEQKKKEDKNPNKRIPLVCVSKPAELLLTPPDAPHYIMKNRESSASKPKKKKNIFSSVKLRAEQRKRSDRAKQRWLNFVSCLNEKPAVKSLFVTRGVCQIDTPGIITLKKSNGERRNILSTLVTKYVKPAGDGEGG